MKRIPAEGIAGDALREAASEFGAVTELVTAALRRHYGLAANDFGVWPHSMYPDRVIVRREGKLIEFGYAVSDANEVTLGAAVEVMLETKPVAAAPMREAAATEIGQRVELVRTAVREKIKLTIPERYVSISAIYSDRVVVDLDGRMYAYAYTIGEDNVVAVGERTEVVVEHRPVNAPMREAAADDWFIEAKQANADKPARYLVRVIKTGLSKNNVNYPTSVLREAAPLFDGARVFVKSDDVHIKGGGKDFNLLVGKLSEARFVETTKGNGEIQAVMDVLESSVASAQLREAVTRGMTDLFGLSIDATGPSTQKGKFREATKITKVASVDLIIEPGAGGQVIRFVEAHQEPDHMLRQQMLDQIRTRDASRADALINSTDEDVLTAYREAFQAVATDTAPAGLTAADLQAHTRFVEARADAKVRISGSKLPQAAQDRVLQRFAEATDADALSTDKVDAAITAENAYINSFRESAPISGLGVFADVQGKTRQEVVDGMLDDLFSRKKTMSFREAYIEITGDRNITGQFDKCDSSRLAEASGTFREAVNSATFSNILGNAITRQMLNTYQLNDLYNDWRDLVDIVPVRDFRTQERTRIGGYANLPAVAQAAAYAALTTPGDEKSTYAVTKRGGLETVTIEAIANDDVGLIQRMPTALGIGAARTLYEFVYGFLDTNPVIYDGLALFIAGHNNTAVAAMDAISYSAARLRLMKQAELSSAKRLGLIARHLYVPADMEEAAFNLFVRGTNQDETFTQSRKPKTHVVAHWTDTNNWYVTADKAQVPLIQLGFFNGQEEPELFVQDSPTQGSLFASDQITYKIRHIYGGAVMDFRGFDGSIVP